MNNFCNHIILGNNLISWLTAIEIIVVSFVIMGFVKSYLLKFIENGSLKTDASFDGLIVTLIDKAVYPFLYYIAFYGGLNWLELSPGADLVLTKLIVLAATFYFLKIINVVLKYYLSGYFIGINDGENKDNQACLKMKITLAIIWIPVIVFLLDNLGYNISTTISILVLGAIVIAIEAPALPGDLFRYFGLLFDRPFEMGDFLMCATHTIVL